MRYWRKPTELVRQPCFAGKMEPFFALRGLFCGVRRKSLQQFSVEKFLSCKWRLFSRGCSLCLLKVVLLPYYGGRSVRRSQTRFDSRKTIWRSKINVVLAMNVCEYHYFVCSFVPSFRFFINCRPIFIVCLTMFLIFKDRAGFAILRGLVNEFYIQKL